MNKETITKELVNYQEAGEQISHDLCAKMINTHQLTHGSNASFSFVIGKNIIEKVLAQPGCVGVRVYDAINEHGEKTLVTFGINASGKNILEFTSVNEHGKITVTEGMGVDKILGPYRPGISADDYPLTVD